jgi:hypothetical protein
VRAQRARAHGRVTGCLCRAVAAHRARLEAMSPPCPRGRDAGRGGQGLFRRRTSGASWGDAPTVSSWTRCWTWWSRLFGWASGSPAGGRRVGAAPRVAAHLAHNSNTARSHITHAQKKGRMQQRDEQHVTPRTTTTAAAANAAVRPRVSQCPRGRDAGRGGQGLFRRRTSGAP